MNLLDKLAGCVLPAWSRWLLYVVLAEVCYCLGIIHGERVAGQQHIDYVTAQAAQTVAIARAQTKVVIKTEVEYRDRIQKIYLKGDEIEKQVLVYVTPVDDVRFGVNAGFVRAYNVAWSGDDAGPAGGSDREPAGLSLAEIADADAHNATSCRVWREQVIGLREFYTRLKLATEQASAP